MSVRQVALFSLLGITLVTSLPAVTLASPRKESVVAVADGPGVRYQYKKVTQHGVTMRVPINARWITGGSS